MNTITISDAINYTLCCCTVPGGSETLAVGCARVVVVRELYVNYVNLRVTWIYSVLRLPAWKFLYSGKLGLCYTCRGCGVLQSKMAKVQLRSVNDISMKFFF